VLSEEQSMKYNMFFPNISLTYAGNSFQTAAGFERKANYPSYYQLRSNIQNSSPFLYKSGNPMLQPQIKNKFSLMFTWKYLQAMMGYTVNNNGIHQIIQQFDNETFLLLRGENINRSRGSNIGLSYSPTFGVWRPQLEAGVMRQQLLATISFNRLYNKVPLKSVLYKKIDPLQPISK